MKQIKSISFNDHIRIYAIKSDKVDKKEDLGRRGFVHPERLRIDGMTKRLKQTKQLTGFPGNPNATTFFIFSVVSSAKVRGFPGFILIYKRRYY